MIDLYHIECHIGGFKREYVDTLDNLAAAIERNWPGSSQTGAGAMIEVWEQGPYRRQVVARFVSFLIHERWATLPERF